MVMHNGRLLLSPIPTTSTATPESAASSPSVAGEPLHELDLVLLSSVERAKTAGAGIAALLTTTEKEKTMKISSPAAVVNGDNSHNEGDAAADMYVADLQTNPLNTHSHTTHYQPHPP